MGVFDGHSDLLYDVAHRRSNGERRVLERYHLNLLRQGDVEGLVLSLWAHPEEKETYAQATEKLLCYAKEEFAECPWLRLVRTAAEAEQAKLDGKIYAFLGVEGMAAIGRNLAGIDRYADFGARMGMLTWNEENALATGAGGDSQNGLTELGKEAVRRMQRRGMLVDVSHLNDGGFADVIRQTEGPVIASHSNCRALCDVRRNLTDDQLRAIRDTGGVVGINVYHNFVHADPEKQSIEMLCRHVCRMAEIMGVEYVACGFDFCGYFDPDGIGPKGLEDAAGIRRFFDCLERFGMSLREREMIARENFLRVLT